MKTLLGANFLTNKQQLASSKQLETLNTKCLNKYNNSLVTNTNNNLKDTIELI